MAESEITPRWQLGVLVCLLLLTAATVAISFVNVEGSWHLGLGMIIAVVKAGLVLLYFMHVIHSRSATRAVILVALFWFLGVMVALTFTDYTTRELPLRLPGH